MINVGYIEPLPLREVNLTGGIILLIIVGVIGIFLWLEKDNKGLVKSGVKLILRTGLRIYRWAVRKMKESEFSEYKLALGELIVRAEKKYTSSTMREFPKCPYCGFLMMFRHSKIVTTVGPVRDDQGWKCRVCFHTAHFGIPMTRADALKEIELRGGPVLTRPSERPDEDGNELVKERLRRLGYIE